MTTARMGVLIDYVTPVAKTIKGTKCDRKDSGSNIKRKYYDKTFSIIRIALSLVTCQAQCLTVSDESIIFNVGSVHISSTACKSEGQIRFDL